LISQELEIKNKLGLHARAAAKLVHAAAKFQSEIKVRKGDEVVDAKSILGILLLAAAQGSTIILTAHGEDEAAAVDSIRQLIDSRFDEQE
jgi:phosphocarrier protein HPr